MAFRAAEYCNMARFNSSVSSDFLDFYQAAVDDEIQNHNSQPKHKSFAPSSFRCRRISWFRLRGVEPDTIPVPDRGLQFTADVGTACHEMIQRRLIDKLGSNWIDVEEYIKDKNLSYSVTKKGYESQVECTDIPVRFACDGLINYQDKIRLLEIKSCDHSSFVDLDKPKPKHIDQVTFYCERLDLDDVLFLYIDRQYGDVKCFEHKVSFSEKEEVRRSCEFVIECVETNIAPDGLPKGDPDCTPNMCPYYEKCKSWGR